MNYSWPGSSVPGIFQARILEWVAILFSRESSRPRDRTQVSCIAGRIWATEELQDSVKCIPWGRTKLHRPKAALLSWLLLLSLHPLASLISNCSKLPLGAQGKSWRLSLVLASGINKKQWTQEGFCAQELHSVLLSSFHLVQLNALQHH